MLSMNAHPAAAQPTFRTEAWPQLRGAAGNGYAPDAVVPNQWEASDYAWQLQLPGAGVGSPVIFEQRVYVLNADPAKQKRSLVAIDLGNGRIAWERDFPLEPHPQHARNTFASSTPFVDDSGIYVAFADPQHVTLAALEFDGEIRWERDLGTWQSQHGFGTSPVIYDNKLILFNSQQADQLNPGEKPGESRMMAFDPESGRGLWTTPLTTTRVCYGVPALYISGNGQKQLIGANTGDGVFALDLETGKRLWNLEVFKARCVSSPFVVDDLIFGSAGSGGGGNHLVAVRAEEKNDKFIPQEVYRMEKFAPYVPTPAIVGQRLYMVDDKGIASCVNATSGEVVWNQRLGGSFGASPVVLGNKILAISLDGQATILETGDEFKKLSSFSLGGPVQATPAYADGALILRVGNTICCLGGKRI